MSEAPRKAWVGRFLRLDIGNPQAYEDLLNNLAQDGFQIFGPPPVVLVDGNYYAIVTACDTALLGMQQGASLAKSMGLLSDKLASAVAAGQAGPPPGIAP